MSFLGGGVELKKDAQEQKTSESLSSHDSFYGLGVYVIFFFWMV